MPRSSRFEKSLAKRLVSRRNELGLTQTDVAKKVGVGKQAYAHWETEHNGVPLKKLPLLAKALDLDIADLLDLENRPRG